ncbi:MAG: VWA domain-containing protein [Puniceicoccales bacterium]|nr:VWA domain-containing protein [Puniceicoccales bacterium]
MNLLYSFWLWIGLASCSGLIAFFLYSEKKQHARQRKLVTDRAWRASVVNANSHRQNIKYFLCLLGILSLAIALARPRWGYTWKEYHSQGVDVLFAVDVSQSMLAEDIKPNRLERTKIAIQDFVQQLHGHRIGLIAFAYDSFIQCPMTLDYRAFLQSLEAFDIHTIPQQGTAIASAIQAAEKALEKTRNERIVLLFSDGEELKKDAIDAAEAAAKNGIHIFTIGVGSLEGGMIPLQGENHTIHYLQDAAGKNVITKLDESTLQKIAEITQGRYIHLSMQELQQLFEEIQERFPVKKQEVYREKVFTERFPYFLLLAIGCWFIEALLSTYRRPRRRHLSCLIYGLMAFEFHGGIPESFAIPSKGEQFFAKQQYDQAQAYYEKKVLKHPQDSKLLYNLGTTYLAQENFPQAVENLEKALTTSELDIKDKIFFNLGNAYFEQGKQIPEKEMETIQKLWEKSILQYDNALELSKDYAEAENNRRCVQQCLDELLRKRQQQEKNSPHNSPQQSPSDGQQSNSDNSQNSNNSPSSQGEDNPEPQNPGKSNSDEEKSPQDNPSQEDKKNDPSPSSSHPTSDPSEKPKSSDSKQDQSQQDQKESNDPTSPQGKDLGKDKESNSANVPPEQENKASSGEQGSKNSTQNSPEKDHSPQKSQDPSSQKDSESRPPQQGSQPSKDSAPSRGEDPKNAQEHPSTASPSEKEGKNSSDGQSGKGSVQSSANRNRSPQRTPSQESSSKETEPTHGINAPKEHSSPLEEEQNQGASPSIHSMARPTTEAPASNPDGKMTSLEAKALLDSEAGREKKLPFIYGSPSPHDALQPW